MYNELYLNLHLFIFPVYTPLHNLLAKKKSDLKIRRKKIK